MPYYYFKVTWFIIFTKLLKNKNKLNKKDNM